MDEIMTCDRCGNQFVGELLTEEMKVHDIPVSRIRCGNSQTHEKVMLLCPTCAKSFVTWFKEKENG